jgi:hypothetical protein
MRRRFAPSHDLVARMVFVPSDDTAWRTDLIDAECGEMSKDATDYSSRAAIYMHPETGHPFWRYQRGETRYDIDAADLQPYIDRSKTPETWRFRRLTLAERGHCRTLERAGSLDASREYAFGCAVTSVDGAFGPMGEALVAALAKMPRDSDAILKAAENYSASSVQEVGQACIWGSQDLTPLEKKA